MRDTNYVIDQESGVDLASLLLTETLPQIMRNA
jgi:hypothetical protein